MNLSFKKSLPGLLLFAFLLSGPAWSQKDDLSKEIPLDPNVKTGKLANGLSYYIRKNSKPEKRVELRLVVNAGSMMEDEDQLGLAHFTEHMCFNGTKNFKKNELIDYLQSQGVKFGADLNAYTSFDETVYMLPIPSDKPDILDKGFQILEDWAHNVSFDHEEIDKERGVVIEEWRGGRGAGQRMRDKWFPLVFKDSRYAKRLPIGEKTILENFKYETIKRFYKDWYRPDLMAVVVVGDIDVADIENKIKTYFGRIAPVVSPKERKLYEVPGHSETLVAVTSDKEAPFTNVSIYYKHPTEEMKSQQDYRRKLLYDIFSGMLNERLEELTQKPEPPFIFGYVDYGSFVRSKNVYTASAQVNEKDIEKGLRTLLTENKKVLEFGFNQSELDRYVKNMLRRYEQAYNERNKTNSDRYVYEYFNHFLSREPFPGIEFEFNFVKNILPGVRLDEINTLAKKWITNENRVVVVTAPEKEGVQLPTENRIREILKETEGSKVEAYVDKVSSEPLMKDSPKAGEVKELTVVKALEATELTFSNGLKVLLKPTNFKDDEILMASYSYGGSSLYPDVDHYSAGSAASLVAESGLKSFSSTDLQKMLTGKVVRVNPYIGQLSEGISGSASPKDLETMLQLVHLYFTAPREDKDAFQSYVTKNKSFYQNLTSSPQFYFIGEQAKVLSQNHPRAGGLPKPEDLDKIDFKRAMQVYRERFAEAGDFVFFFVGNFQIDQIKPLLEKYLGSLPTLKRKENFKDLGIRPPKGVIKKDFKRGSDPKSQVSLTFTGELKNDKDGYFIRSFNEILRNKLIENLREEKGGVYSPQTNATASKFPYANYTISVNFTCAPENVNKLVDAVFEEIKKIQKDGPTAEDLNKIKEAQRRDLEKNSKENRFWLNTMQTLYYDKRKPEDFLTYKRRIEDLNAKDIQNAAKTYCDFNNYVRLVMYPEEVKPAPAEKSGSSDPRNSKDLSPEKLIDKYLQAIGGREKLKEVKSLRLLTTSEVMGQQMNLEESKKSPGMYLMIQKSPMGEVKIVSDGKKAAMVMMGQKQEIPAEQMNSMLVQASIFMEMDYQALGLKAAFVKTESINGKDAHQIDFTTATGQKLSRWYDAETCLLVKYVQGPQDIVYDDYKEFKGIKFPVSGKSKIQGMEMSSKVTDVQVNPALEESIFKTE